MPAQEKDPSLVEEFLRRRRRQMLVTIPVVLAILGLVIMKERGDSFVAGLSSSVVTGGFFGLIIVLAIFSFRNWRCPACHGYLGKGMSPRFCPRCGAALQ